MKLIIETTKSRKTRIRVWDGTSKPALDVEVEPRVAVAAIQAVQGIVRKELGS